MIDGRGPALLDDIAGQVRMRHIPEDATVPALVYLKDYDSIDLDTNESYVIKRVLEFCQMNDWYQLVSRYGLERIVRVSQRLRTLPL